jgi:hypothetical protein
VFDKLIQVLVFGCGDRRIADDTGSAPPCGEQVAGPSPVDRRKQGLQRLIVTDAGGIRLDAVPAAAANRRDDGLLGRPWTPWQRPAP